MVAPLRRALPWTTGLLLLAAVVLAAAALIPGSHSADSAAFSRVTVAGHASGADQLRRRQTRVFGSNISARRYGTIIAAREEGVTPNGQPTSDLDPVSPRAFRGPVTAYRRYAERWAGRLANDLPRLRRALRTGDRPAGKRAWDIAFADYLHLGAVYGLLPATLNDRLAGVPSSLGQRRFVGLHRIEKGLWTGASPRSLLPMAAALTTAVTELRHSLPTVPITPLDYATRAHEILEDAQRDLMSGTQVPWSGAGVLGTAAGVAVTRELIGTLGPLLRGRDNTLVVAQNWLAQLERRLDGVRRPNGSYPALAQLTLAQRERVDGALAGTLGALSAVPGTLETATVPVIPKLPVAR